MFKKLVLLSIISISYSFAMSASMVQEAPESKLACIKGIGVKRTNAIINYRKKDRIDTLDEMLNIRGIGKAILKNIKNDVQKKSCILKDKKVIAEPKKERAKEKRKIISAE